MKTIEQNNAMICIKRGCELIWEGPSTTCPGCGWHGVTFKDITDALDDNTAQLLIKGAAIVSAAICKENGEQGEVPHA